MIELTVQELEDKIKKAQQDIVNCLTENSRDALTVYLDYLKDELKEAKKREKSL